LPPPPSPPAATLSTSGPPTRPRTRTLPPPGARLPLAADANPLPDLSRRACPVAARCYPGPSGAIGVLRHHSWAPAGRPGPPGDEGRQGPDGPVPAVLAGRAADRSE